MHGALHLVAPAAPIPFPFPTPEADLPPRFILLERRAPRRALRLADFLDVLGRERLDDLLPDLKAHLRQLAHYNRTVFGFGFDPAEVRVLPQDLPRMLAGLRHGILTRPLVLDSPSEDDARRLGFDRATPVLEYRIQKLAESGIHFPALAARLALWRELRRPLVGTLADIVQRHTTGLLGARDAFFLAHEDLPRPETVGDRIGAAPRLVLVGRNDELWRNPVLADDAGGPVVVEREQHLAAAGYAVRQGCRFLSPEAALLLLGAPGVRDGATSKLATTTAIWLAGVSTYGRVARIQSQADGILLECADAWSQSHFHRLAPTSE